MSPEWWTRDLEPHLRVVREAVEGAVVACPSARSAAGRPRRRRPAPAARTRRPGPAPPRAAARGRAGASWSRLPPRSPGSRRHTLRGRSPPRSRRGRRAAMSTTRSRNRSSAPASWASRSWAAIARSGRIIARPRVVQPAHLVADREHGPAPPDLGRIERLVGQALELRALDGAPEEDPGRRDPRRGRRSPRRTSRRPPRRAAPSSPTPPRATAGSRDPRSGPAGSSASGHRTSPVRGRGRRTSSPSTRAPLRARASGGRAAVRAQPDDDRVERRGHATRPEPIRRAAESRSRISRFTPSIGTRSWVIESRSRTVTAPSSSDSTSTVTHHGVPISSWRR